MTHTLTNDVVDQLRQESDGELHDACCVVLEARAPARQIERASRKISRHLRGAVTPSLLREWNACWDDDDIKMKFRDRAFMTAREVADARVDHNDRMWVLTRILSYADPRKLFEFCIACVELTLSSLPELWRLMMEVIVKKIRPAFGYPSGKLSTIRDAVYTRCVGFVDYSAQSAIEALECARPPANDKQYSYNAICAQECAYRAMVSILTLTSESATSTRRTESAIRELLVQFIEH